ncbi:MAG TPA: TonB-dependent receptor, partial [Nannocystaceae bacterium]|nr:TonB-dependent receptor [Nannocystaceae bacterium]
LDLDPATTAAPHKLRPIFLWPTAESRYRTVVAARRDPARHPAPVERHLDREELRTLPGSQGDPLRALQSLPGVARTPFGLGLLVLRGAAPTQSQVFLGDHPVPRAFHLSGLASVVSTDAIAGIDYAPSNAAASFGNLSGGLVVIAPRVGRRDRHRGAANVDLGGVGGYAEGPLGKGSYILSARRAHLDLPLRLVGRQNPLAPTFIPTYYDYQAFYDRPLPGGGALHVGLLGSADRFAIAQPRSDGDATYFDLRPAFHRVDLAYRKRVGDLRVLLTPSLRFDRQALESYGDSARSNAWVTSLRGEIGHRLGPHLDFTLGADALITAATTRETSYIGVDEDYQPVGPSTTTTTHENRALLGTYLLATIGAGPLTIDPGFRLAAFVVGGDRTFAADPRLALRLDLARDWQIHGAVGLYSQAYRLLAFNAGGVLPGEITDGGSHIIIPRQILAYFDPARSTEERGTLRLRRALQASLGVARTLPGGLRAELLGFVRDQDDGLPVAGSANYRSRTLARGVEAIVRKDFGKRLHGWVAYTLMWVHSDLWPTPADDPIRRVDDFDQRHNVVALLAAKLPKNWQVGARYRLVAGLPYTPVVGAVQQGAGYAGLAGERNSARFPLFHQLDLRVDKRWVLRRVVVDAYLDLLNAYNAANTEALIYSSDFRQVVSGVGMPILPLLGVRVDL